MPKQQRNVTHRFGIGLTDEQFQKLQELCERERRSVSNMIAILVEREHARATDDGAPHR
jgi:hypothetical protein